MLKLKENFWAQIIIIYTRFLLGGAFVFASIIKIKGRRFTSVSGEDAPFGTAFHFFETMYQSGVYWQFLGFAQLLSGFLLMTQRYSKLGAVINFPIILNVFIITISMDFAYTPVLTGMMLLANGLLLIWHWNELRILFNLPLISDIPKRLENLAIWELTGMIMFLFTAVYRILKDGYDPVFWFLGCTGIGLSAFLIGSIKWKRLLQ